MIANVLSYLASWLMPINVLVWIAGDDAADITTRSWLPPRISVTSKGI